MAPDPTTSDVYAPPAWGVDGRNEFGVYVDVIKGGVVVETLSSLPLTASRSFVLAGRMTPACDLVLQHPSISRVHAALQFDAHGALFLRDMNSTHGTFVNKRRVPPNEYVRLHIGDVVVFGESTRLYAVCGPPELLPEEYDSENLQQLRAKLAARRERERERQRVGTKPPTDDGDGVSWGFREDAEEEEDDDEEDDDEENGKSATKKRSRASEDLPEYLRGIKESGRNSYESSVREADVGAKDQRLFEQLQNKIRKMENLELEKTRILAKQNDLQGLTEGQEKTLERNAARIESLLREIHALEDQIHAKNAQRATSRAAGANKQQQQQQRRAQAQSRYDYDSDEDEFYDRTKANQQRRSQQPIRGGAGSSVKTKEVLTVDSIQAKIKEIQDELTRVRREELASAAKADDSVGDGAAEEMDSLESFMQATTKSLQQSEADRHRQRRQALEAELKQHEQLLAIAMPALASVAATAPPSSVAKETQKQSQAPIEDSDCPKPNALPESSTPAPPPVDAPDATPAIKEPEQVAVIPLHKEQRKNEMIAHSASKPDSSKSAASARKHESDASDAARKRRRVVGPTLPPPSGKVDANVLEGGDRVWVPPANQSGDGRTALNDKYGY
ncbi:hypothetical protein PINS_up005341 [Pythium insidiosum]|nr:hypothetical protein PINS_up005341 [Pythium insidiosum]